MNERPTELISNIQTSQQELSALLLSVAENQDWQPEADEWSFRFIAGHMATVDKDCFFPRMSHIVAELQPKFIYYLHDEWNFGHLDLTYYLDEWAATRQTMINFVRALPEEALLLTGTHEKFGTMTVLDILQLMFDHDQEHIEHLQMLLIQYKTEG